MYAIIAHSGKQIRVEESDQIVLDRITAEVGSTVEITDVLLIGGDNVKVGAPNVDGASVTVEVLSHELGDKRDVYTSRRPRRPRPAAAARR